MATEFLDARGSGLRPVDRPAGPPGDGVTFGDGGGGPELTFDPGRFGLWAFLGTVSMLFIGFTSAYIVRRTGFDWRPLPAPALLWWNTAALLASSVTLETARRRRDAMDLAGLRAWLGATALLALAFVAGQVQAWRLLSRLGYFLSSNPHSSFFYLLTSLHGLHLLGGLVALVYVTAAAFRLRIGFKRRNAVEVTAIYWHFMDVLWIYLLALLYFWS